MDIYKTGWIPLGTVPDTGAIAPPPPARCIAVTPLRDPALDARISTMLGACGITAEETRMLSPADDQVAFVHLRQTAGLKYIFLFGVDPRVLGIQANIPPDDLQPFGGITFLLTRTPQALFSDNAYRGALWNNTLRPHFKPDAA